MKLTRKQRDEIRYALEDCGVPEVLAFMAARNAAAELDREGLQKWPISTLFVWGGSPEGHDFWAAVAVNAGQEEFNYRQER